MQKPESNSNSNSNSVSPQSNQTNSIPDSSSSKWDQLGSDLTEIILSHLPIPSIIRAALVCKNWNSTINSYSFNTRISNSKKLPWFFVFGQNNNNRVFAFDPESHEWIKLQDTIYVCKESFTASNGFLFITGPGKFDFKPVFSETWRGSTTTLRYFRCDSVVGVYNDPDCSENSRFIIVGVIGKGGCLGVDLYNPQMDSWEICPPLPEIFRAGNSLKLLSSALFRGKFYVFGIHSSFISCFDLKKRSWSSVQTLRPPGVMFSYLISCGDRLVLAGVCSVNDEPEFILWRIDETSLEFREIGIMPQELLSCFFGSEGEWRFGSLKCVGMANIVYVFSEERNRNYTACFCEITSSGKCRWRKVPDLPDHISERDLLEGDGSAYKKECSYCRYRNEVWIRLALSRSEKKRLIQLCQQPSIRGAKACCEVEWLYVHHYIVPYFGFWKASLLLVNDQFRLRPILWRGGGTSI